MAYVPKCLSAAKYLHENGHAHFVRNGTCTMTLYFEVFDMLGS